MSTHLVYLHFIGGGAGAAEASARLATVSKQLEAEKEQSTKLKDKLKKYSERIAAMEVPPMACMNYLTPCTHMDYIHTRLWSRRLI